MDAPVRVWKFKEIPWEEIAPRGGGAAQKTLAQGEGGLWVVHASHPPGFTVKPHSHREDEMLYVIEGGCQILDGPLLEANDAIVLKAGQEYGFSVGDQGMRFLTIRKGLSRAKFR